MKSCTLKDITPRQLASRDGERLYSQVRSLTNALGISSLHVHSEVLESGRYSAKPHAHTTKDELLLVTQGRGIAIVNGVEHPLEAGDVIGFRGADHETHVIHNPAQTPLHYLSIGTRPADDHVCYVDS